MKINMAYCDESFHPYRVIRIRHSYILDDPFPDPRGMKLPEHSPEPPRLPSGRLDDEDPLDENLGKSAQEIAEAEQLAEAEVNAEVLMMVGFSGFFECFL
jgi:peptidyl-prolyl cis-trans isomerase-like 4